MTILHRDEILTPRLHYGLFLLTSAGWWLLLTLVALATLWPAPGLAALLYVDHDNTKCNDRRSSASSEPYCTVAAAFRDLRTGDTMRIRESARPYPLSVVATQAGPITIEADAGHRPVLTSDGSDTLLLLLNVSDWTIQGLTFDGAGQEVQYAIVVDANSRHVQNIRIQHNRFVNLGGTIGHFEKPMAIELTNSRWKKRQPQVDAFSVSDSLIQDNIFDNCIHGGISLKHTKNITIANNKMMQFRCGRYTDGRIGVQAIKISFSSLDTVIRGNRIGDFQPSAQCPLQPGRNRKNGEIARSKYVGIYCDVGPQRGLVTDNIIANIDPGRSASAPNHQGAAIGIQIESRCTDWKIHNNLIYNIGRYGILNGSRSTGFTDRTELMHNTIYNIAGNAISIRKGEGLKIKHNIIANYGGVGIDFINYAKCQKSGKKCHITEQTQVFHQKNHEINHNMFWTENDDQPVARWFSHKTNLDLNGWQTATGGYDQLSTYANPNFVDAANGNFTLQNRTLSIPNPLEGSHVGYHPKSKTNHTK
jgi:parallel beta-helix repeat protein